VDLTLAENEAHYEQQLRNCQHFFEKKSIYFTRNASTECLMNKLSIYCLISSKFLYWWCKY